jgi:hypothetical protein
MFARLATLVFWTAAVAFLLYLVLRAAGIPITHDEAATCLNHVPRTAWDILTYSKDPVPNNHIVNTLGIKMFAGLFGMGHFSARIPALLGGLIYLAAGIALIRTLSNHAWVRLFGLIVLLGNPFVDEFFALARGYGLAVGLMLGATWAAWRYLAQAHPHFLKTSLLLGVLAVLANFTLLNFFAPLWVLLAWISVSVRKTQPIPWKPLVTYPLALAALCYWPLTRISGTDQLRFWGESGFYKETLKELVKSSIRNHPYLDDRTVPTLAILAAAFAIGCWAVALVRWRRQSWTFSVQDPFTFAAFLLAGTFAVNMVQFFFLNIPFLGARTSIFFYPLFALQLFAAAVQIERAWRGKVWYLMAPVGLFALVNFNRCADLRIATEWWFDQANFEVLDYIKARYEAEGRSAPFTLDTQWLEENSMMFHVNEAKNNYSRYVQLPPWHPGRPPQGDTEFYYTHTQEEHDLLRDRYEVVLTTMPGSQYLMRKKR